MKLLIAEDDINLNNIIVKKLAREGFSVESCLNGADALDRLLYADYDAAILDIMMPNLDGTQVVSKLRSSGKSTLVILLTAKDAIADKVKGLNIGANDYIVKPFSFDELIARIMAVTRTASGNISNVINLGGLSVDTGGHIVTINGKQITLTGKEYDLLEYLIVNKNRILSKEKIIRHVWGYSYDSGEKIVEVYINYLRKKISEVSEKKLIHTVRGIGYVMKEDS